MIQSIYTTNIPINDKWHIIANGLTCAIDLCPSVVGKALAENRLNDIPQRAKETLASRGYLCKTGSEEQKLEDLAALIRLFTAKGNIYAIILSYDCNFRCSYCCERWRLEKGEDWLHARMSDEMIDMILQELDRHDTKKNDRIVLYGGEPLLPENRHAILKLWDELGKRGRFVSEVITNGYYVDEFLPILCRNLGLKLQITLDGSPEMHDKRRFLQDGKGTFEKIAQNVTLALNANLKVELRVNIDETNESAVAAIRHEAEKRGWDKLENCHIKLSRVRGRHVQIPDGVEFHSGEVISSRLEESAQRGGYIMPQLSLCGSPDRLKLVDPFGFVYPCLDVSGQEKFASGQMTEQGIINEDENYFRGREITALSNCKICPFVLFCGGGCSARSLISSNPEKGDCNSTPEVVSEALRKIGAAAIPGNVSNEGITPLTQSYQGILDLIGPGEREILAKRKVPVTLYRAYCDIREKMKILNRRDSE